MLLESCLGTGIMRYCEFLSFVGFDNVPLQLMLIDGIFLYLGGAHWWFWLVGRAIY